MRCLVAVVVFVCLHNISVSSGQQVSVEIHPRDDVTLKEPHDSALLNCTLSSGGSVKSFTWTKSSQALRSLNNSAGPVYWLDLTLHGNRTSGGLYTCEAVGENNETDTAEIVVHVKGKPQIITDNSKYMRSPQMQNIGSSLKLVCYATGFPKVHFEWRRNGAKIQFEPQGNYRKIPEKYGLDFVIVDLKEKDDEANFNCMARNKFGTATHTIQVLTKDPWPRGPRITAQSKRMNVTLGERNVTLVCITENANFIVSTTFWKFKGTTYYPGSHDKYTVVEKPLENEASVKTSLIINNEVTEGDEGNFTCGLSVGGSSVQDDMYLSVEEPRNVHVTKARTGLLVGLSISAGLVLLIAAVILWRRKIKRPIRFPSGSFEKDVFITYSGNDCQWVDEYLIPLFEENGVQYIIHTRDFVPGRAVVDNMADSVNQSRIVLVVMSKNYMASGFCREELKMALRRSLDDEMQENSVIVIRIDDIRKKELPASVRHKTFLDFTSREERTTWDERLLRTVKPPEQRLPASPGMSEESGERQPLLGEPQREASVV